MKFKHDKQESTPPICPFLVETKKGKMSFQSKEHKINYLKKLIREDKAAIFRLHRQIESNETEIKRLENVFRN